MALEITSSAFGNGEMIPMKYTCDGDNMSVPLQWSGLPKGTKALALIMDDPDTPKGTFVHWVVYNIPVEVAGFAENIESYPKGVLVGQNSQGENGYKGPCPPDKKHRYFFKLYALDRRLELKEGATKEDVVTAMKDRVLGQAELMGEYDRPGKEAKKVSSDKKK
ncbi:MAG: YbhB/YbcL family Raf kinase inhibitor-like protein [Verrucomicrobia bacterium]|nr:MAG: YbhB/YbcL family Raf kinase inhibitor-like protein [Verrucomicrobiota bacterium]